MKSGGIKPPGFFIVYKIIPPFKFKNRLGSIQNSNDNMEARL